MSELTDPSCLQYELITNLAAKKNAISLGWPSYLAKCTNTLLINRKGQMQTQGKTTEKFYDEKVVEKQINVPYKFGLSK